MFSFSPEDGLAFVLWLLAGVASGLAAVVAFAPKLIELLFEHQLSKRRETLRQQQSREQERKQRLRVELRRSAAELRDATDLIEVADAEDAYCMARARLHALLAQAPAQVPELLERVRSLSDFLEVDGLLSDPVASALIAVEFRRLFSAIEAHCLSLE
ncbi:MAG: hypothetical protein JNJ71_13215 [Rubrivivax sp.]|nr:hypothetical protein [Rubrivivax sp.]